MASRLAKLVAAVAFAGMAGSTVVADSALAAPVQRPTARVSAKAAAAMLSLINADRRAYRLRPLSFDSVVSSVAVSHSVDMATHDYFSHTSRSGASPFDRLASSSIRYRIAGENLGYDGGGSTAAMLQAIETAMLKSPEHRANLLRQSFSRVGIGVARVRGAIYVTEDFTG